MRANRTSGLMSGEGKRSDAAMADATAPFLDSTTFFQNKREAADFLSFPYFGEKQSVCGAC
jgi:hypothetical protein